MPYIHDSAVLITAPEGVAILDLYEQLIEDDSPFAPALGYVAQQIARGEKRRYGKGVAPVESLELGIRMRTITETQDHAH